MVPLDEADRRDIHIGDMLMPTVAQTVADLVRQKRPLFLCDDCIAHLLSLKRRQQANQATTALEHSSDFERRLGACSVCGESNKMVIRAH